MPHYYFLVNDTRYDNHHGCLTVIRNLHLGMEKRQWHSSGSLPVSSSVTQLKHYQDAIRKARLIIVNGEGSLHHNSRNTRLLLDIISHLQKTHPVVIVNALWQDNDQESWLPVLKKLSAIYVRDKKSQNQLHNMGIKANYAPDLTFYHYEKYADSSQDRPFDTYGCTDSVLKPWNQQAFNLTESHSNLEYITLLTAHYSFACHTKHRIKQLKYLIYPFLWHWFKAPVPIKYKTLRYAKDSTEHFLKHLHQYQAVCVARYHALCFVIQQNIPFLFVPSNSHKSESLIEEIGLPLKNLSLNKEDNMVEQLQVCKKQHIQYQETIHHFCITSKQQIDHMFDDICSINNSTESS